jgi:hypothetical protein
LQKLGVDAVMVSGAPFSLDLGGDAVLHSGLGLPQFESIADVTLDLAQGQRLNEITDLASTLKDSGIDHVSMGWAELLHEDQTAINAITGAGLDFKMASSSHAGTINEPTLDAMLQDALNNGVALSNGQDMGTLVQTLYDAGVANLAPTHLVTIGDDLAAALHESGMLNALPAEDGVQIDAGTAQHLTTLKAMADMGVDHVLANAGAQVDLGEKFSQENLADLLSHFVNTDNNPSSIKTIFDNLTELNIGQVADYTTTLDTLVESGIGDKLFDLGIHKVVAQVEVQILGAPAHESYEFDLEDLLHRRPS